MSGSQLGILTHQLISLFSVASFFWSSSPDASLHNSIHLSVCIGPPFLFNGGFYPIPNGCITRRVRPCVQTKQSPESQLSCQPHPYL